MGYFISFLEGVITFISPCLLPMLPIYLSYFAGSTESATLKNALGFVLGFTTVFVIMGAFAGSIGGFLSEYKTAINIVSGALVILFGLNFMGFVRIPLLNSNRQVSIKKTGRGFIPSILFGLIFAVGWTPCVGAFLGSAIMLAAQTGHTVKGIVMLLSFSMGLGIPFIVSALLIGKLRSAFDFIKKNYHVINIISGLVLVITGILMATGLMGYYLSMLSI